MNRKLLYHQMLVSPHVGGGAKLAMDIHKYITAERGTLSRLVLPKGGEAERISIKEGFPFTRYDLNRLVDSGPLRSFIENMYLFIRTAGYAKGLVHVHSPFVYGAARPFFLISRFKTVLHIHLNFTDNELRWPLRRSPDLVLLCAGFLRDVVEKAMAEKGARITKIRVIRNAVDIDKFKPLNREKAKFSFGISHDVIFVIMVANIAPHKGQETAIRALELLKRNGYRVVLWIVGDERTSAQGHLNYLKSLTNNLGVSESVNFVGFRNDIPELLRAADFLLLPSRNEGLPLVILEAMASKTLVLAAPTAGIPEVIENGKTGFLISADNFSGYAERIGFLVTNKIEANRIKNLAHQYVCNNHDMQLYCKRILHAYDELLK
jgi:glycosyltransferase involved in cell wall biosynthesis